MMTICLLMALSVMLSMLEKIGRSQEEHPCMLLQTERLRKLSSTMSSSETVFELNIICRMAKLFTSIISTAKMVASLTMKGNLSRKGKGSQGLAGQVLEQAQDFIFI